MSYDKSIDVLNTPIEINNDRIEGYETASKETNDSDLKTLFYKFSQTSQNCKSELVNEIKKLNGTPIEVTRTTGKLFRAWMDIKTAITNKGRKAILNSCEYGEDVAVEIYTKAFKDNIENISTEQHVMLKSQFRMIEADHDKLKEMRELSLN